MADRERLERVALAIYAQLLVMEHNTDSAAEDAYYAISQAERFISVMDNLHPPEQPAAPTPGDLTLLEAAKEMLWLLDAGTLTQKDFAVAALRTAIAREEARRG